jgi:hypothetical protein
VESASLDVYFPERAEATMTQETDAWPEYRVRAKNIAAQSENRIHSDDVARTLGFSGALISGVAVYAYMTRPLVARLGEAWLENGTAMVEFFKPAYQDDELTIRVTPQAPGELHVSARNEAGVELARMHAEPDATPPPLPHVGELVPTPQPGEAERLPVSWDAVRLHEPLWTLDWHPDAVENAAWAESVMDDLPLYRRGAGAPLHPGLVLRAANRVLGHRFILPAWIHVSSRMHFRAAPRAGQRILVHAVPVDKFEKKGHQFAVVNMRMDADGRPCVEVEHIFIFRVREAA